MHGAVPQRHERAGAELRDADRRAGRRFRLVDARRASGVDSLLHVGDDGQSERRAVFESLDGAACVRRRAARCDGRVLERFDLARGADVPRQRVGHSARSAAGGREARFAGQGSRRQVALRTDGSGGRHVFRGRADGMARPAVVHAARRFALLDARAHGDRRLGVSARDTAHVRGRIRCQGDSRVGHDGDVAARHACSAESSAEAAYARGAAAFAGRSRGMRSSAST